MRRIIITLAVGAIVLTLSSVGWAQQISGDYIETRSADVYTGPCFANGEVGLVGDLAILAWRVQEGDWDGVQLDGLGIVGVVKANATLGDPYGSPYPAEAVLIVDQRATSEQRTALVGFAHEMAGDLLKNVVRVDAAPIQLVVGRRGQDQGRATLRAGTIAAVETRSLGDRDQICGNEETYYPPLTQTTHSMPAVAELDQFRGPGLGVSWTSRGKRSAFVGSFARNGDK